MSYPLWAGFTGVKWVAVIEGNTGSVRRSPHAIKILKRVNFMLSKTQPAIESERERRARKCRIPVFPLRRRVAETRFDCCPRPRTPFLLVSEAALALAGREGETQQNSVIFNSCLPEKPAKHPHSPVQKELTAKFNFAAEILWQFGPRLTVYFVNSVARQLAVLANHI